MSKKLLSIMLVIVIGLCSMLTTNAYAILEDEDIYEEKISIFVSALEETQIDTIEFIDNLYDPIYDSVIARLYELNNGYAIIGINSMTIYEYSLCGSNPYNNVSGKKFYSGHFRYFDSDMVHTYEGTNFVNDESAFQFINAERTLECNNVSEISLDTVASTLASSTTKRMLSGTLSTDWVNGYCGPTSAYNMLRYSGYIPSQYYGTTGIYYLNSFMNPTGGSGVTLSSLKNGINSYMNYQGYSQRVLSANYSFYLVQNCINANEPLTLGTSGGGLTTGGHVQTIHGYATVEGDSTTYILYVNNSWGSNNVAITYTGTAPSYLKDHVYYA